jgi:hypothetical protein
LDAELLLWLRQHLGCWAVFSAVFHHAERAPRVTSSPTAESPTIRSFKTSLVSILLRAADRYAYTGCGSTAYCYLFYLGDEQILVHIGKSCRLSACLVRIAGPCPAEYTSVRVYELANSNRNAATVSNVTYVVCAMDPLVEVANEFECWQNVQDTFFCSLRASLL